MDKARYRVTIEALEGETLPDGGTVDTIECNGIAACFDKEDSYTTFFMSVTEGLMVNWIMQDKDMRKAYKLVEAIEKLQAEMGDVLNDEDD